MFVLDFAWTFTVFLQNKVLVVKPTLLVGDFPARFHFCGLQYVHTPIFGSVKSHCLLVFAGKKRTSPLTTPWGFQMFSDWSNLGAGRIFLQPWREIERRTLKGGYAGANGGAMLGQLFGFLRRPPKGH
jgi:hypothetical protein